MYQLIECVRLELTSPVLYDDLSTEVWQKAKCPPFLAFHKRSSLLSATTTGRERLAAARAPREHALASALEDWKISDIQNLSRLLHALSHGTDPTA